MFCRAMLWFCGLVALGGLGWVGAEEDRPGPEVRVMSFNIRYGTADDRENRWDLRREFLSDTVRAFDPDLLGTQETLPFQFDYLSQQLPEYEAFGAGREDGQRKGEMSALFYKRDRFERLAGGHFWLSEMPEEPGTKSWDSSLPRMVTWVKLRDRRQPDRTPLLFLNTHFDHRGTTARIESARLLRQRIEALQGDASVVVTGDFNAPESSAPYRTLLEDRDGKPAPLVDTFRAVHSQRSSAEGTFSNFSASSTSGSRIDWILASADWQIIQAEIDRTSRDGRTPSDHFPVTAILSRTR